MLKTLQLKINAYKNIYLTPDNGYAYLKSMIAHGLLLMMSHRNVLFIFFAVSAILVTYRFFNPRSYEEHVAFTDEVHEAIEAIDIERRIDEADDDAYNLFRTPLTDEEIFDSFVKEELNKEFVWEKASLWERFKNIK